MVKVLLAGIAAIAVSACAATSPTKPSNYSTQALTKEEVRRVEADVRRKLQNPDALISGLKGAKRPSGTLIVCGWANLRDDFPEFTSYVGHRPFVVSYTGRLNGLSGFRMVHFANVKSESPPLYLYCSQRGIPL